MDELPVDVQEQIQAFVESEHDPNHLVINQNGRVFFDKETADIEAYDEIIYSKISKED